MKRKFKPWLYVAAVLLMSVSCKKEQPTIEEMPLKEIKSLSPDDVGLNSCSATTNDWILVSRLENEPADINLGAVLFKRWFSLANYNPHLYQNSILLCEMSLNKVQNLEQTYVFTTEYMKNPRYAYRLWGRLFWARDIIGITGLPILYVQIDKIEKVI